MTDSSRPWTEEELRRLVREEIAALSVTHRFVRDMPSPAEPPAREEEPGRHLSDEEGARMMFEYASEQPDAKVGIHIRDCLWRELPDDTREWCRHAFRFARDIGRSEGAEPYVAWFRKYGEALVKHVQISGLDEFLALLAKAKEAKP